MAAELGAVQAARGAGAAGDGAPAVPHAGDAGAEVTVVIAVELDAQSCRVGVAFRPKHGAEDPSQVDVNLFVPGRSVACQEPALACMLLNAATEDVVAFGDAARRKFEAARDDGRGEK
jgi:hypothetical protein